MAVTKIGSAGSTVQLWVADGAAARTWYERLFGRPPEFRPSDDDTFCEWIFPPGHWEVHVVEQEPAGQQRGRLRFGVEDVVRAHRQLRDEGIEVSEIEDLPGVVRYCNFDDPWGNRLGLYQDLSRFPHRADQGRNPRELTSKPCRLLHDRREAEVANGGGGESPAMTQVSAT